MAWWKTVEHLEDHYDLHRREFPVASIETYDASAQETLAVGARFAYRDRITGLRRLGCYHRETARMVVLDLDGFIVAHFRSRRTTSATCPIARTVVDMGAIIMETSKSVAQTVPGRPRGPLHEVYRRLVGIHAALVERTNSDPEVRPFAVRELMDLLHYIEEVEEEQSSS